MADLSDDTGEAFKRLIERMFENWLRSLARVDPSTASWLRSISKECPEDPFTLVGAPMSNEDAERLCAALRAAEPAIEAKTKRQVRRTAARAAEQVANGVARAMSNIPRVTVDERDLPGDTYVAVHKSDLRRAVVIAEKLGIELADPLGRESLKQECRSAQEAADLVQRLRHRAEGRFDAAICKENDKFSVVVNFAKERKAELIAELEKWSREIDDKGRDEKVREDFARLVGRKIGHEIDYAAACKLALTDDELRGVYKEIAELPASTQQLSIAKYLAEANFIPRDELDALGPSPLEGQVMLLIDKYGPSKDAEDAPAAGDATIGEAARVPAEAETGPMVAGDQAPTAPATKDEQGATGAPRDVPMEMDEARAGTASTAPAPVLGAHAISPISSAQRHELAGLVHPGAFDRLGNELTQADCERILGHCGDWSHDFAHVQLTMFIPNNRLDGLKPAECSRILAAAAAGEVDASTFSLDEWRQEREPVREARRPESIDRQALRAEGAARAENEAAGPQIGERGRDAPGR